VRQQTVFVRGAVLALLTLPAFAGLSRGEEAKPAAPASEPAVLKVGDPAVDGSIIKPFTNQWSMVFTKPDGASRNMGTWTDEVKVEAKNGRSVLTRTQTTTTKAGQGKYVNVVDHKTLAPISSEYTNTKGVFKHADFDGAHVKFKHTAGTPDSKMEEQEATLDPPPFDFNGGMYGLTIVGFPLKEGYSARFPAFNTEDGKIEWTTYQVAGRRKVPAGPGKEVEAWIVNLHFDSGVAMEFAMVKEAPYIIRLVQSDKNGTWTFEML